MAKKAPAPETSESTQVAVYEAPNNPPPLLPEGFDETKIIQHGVDNDTYQQWEPQVGESKLLVFRKAVQVPQDNGRYLAILCTFVDLKTGRPVHKFLGEWLLKEIYEKGYTENNLPLLLTYGGKVRRKRGSEQGEPDTHNWKRYYYTAAEWKALTERK